MFAKPALLISIIQAVLLLGSVEARIWLLERDGRVLFARRFGQAQPAVLKEIASACGGGVCDALADEAISPLLAAQPECAQQDMADKIIDAARQFDPITQAKMIDAAVKYRQAEKNTPPDLSTNPPTLRNSVFCQKAPKNSELDGLVQAQDPANDPNFFFDPATGATVSRGSQLNTFPFGTNVPAPGDQVRLAARSMMDGNNSTSGGENKMGGGSKGNGKGGNMMGGDNKNGTHKHHHGQNKNGDDKGGDNKNGDNKGGNNKAGGNLKHDGGGNMNNSSSLNPMDGGNNQTTGGNINNGTDLTGGNNVNNGTDLTGNNNGTNSTGSNNSTCLTGGSNSTDLTGGNNSTNLTGGNNSTDLTGGNNSTDLTGGNNVNNGTDLTGCNNVNNGTDLTGSNNVTNANGGNNSTNGTVDAGNIGNFGSCSVPEIEFGAGFDGRRETAFQPVDKVSYNHGSAQNIGIITQFMCDQLVNTCKADATAKSTCARAQTAANGAPPKTGQQADAFNAVFGKTTNFSNVTPLDDQGNPVAARRSLLSLGRRFEKDV